MVGRLFANLAWNTPCCVCPLYHHEIVTYGLSSHDRAFLYVWPSHLILSLYSLMVINQGCCSYGYCPPAFWSIGLLQRVCLDKYPTHLNPSQEQLATSPSFILRNLSANVTFARNMTRRLNTANIFKHSLTVGGIMPTGVCSYSSPNFA
jgi:hypothetical protein